MNATGLTVHGCGGAAHPASKSAMLNGRKNICLKQVLLFWKKAAKKIFEFITLLVIPKNISLSG
jgi:hypothetical protein